jgi:PLP dependent protein
MSLQKKINDNLKFIKDKLPSSCSLIAVSKYVDTEEIIAAYESGQRDFGENRVSDLQRKSSELKKLCPEIRWHMIGNLQSKKIKSLLNVENLYAVHSIYDKKHLDLFNQYTKTPLRIFFQINSSKEVQKGGVATYGQILELINMINNECLIFEGLMGMGKLEGNEEDLYKSFLELKAFSNQLTNEFKRNVKTSMGMSGDFEIAIKAGSNFIRVGSAIFK